MAYGYEYGIPSTMKYKGRKTARGNMSVKHYEFIRLKLRIDARIKSLYDKLPEGSVVAPPNIDWSIGSKFYKQHTAKEMHDLRYGNLDALIGNLRYFRKTPLLKFSQRTKTLIAKAGGIQSFPVGEALDYLKNQKKYNKQREKDEDLDRYEIPLATLYTEEELRISNKNLKKRLTPKYKNEQERRMVANFYKSLLHIQDKVAYKLIMAKFNSLSLYDKVHVLKQYNREHDDLFVQLFSSEQMEIAVSVTPLIAFLYKIPSSEPLDTSMFMYPSSQLRKDEKEEIFKIFKVKI